MLAIPHWFSVTFRSIKMSRQLFYRSATIWIVQISPIFGSRINGSLCFQAKLLESSHAWLGASTSSIAGKCQRFSIYLLPFRTPQLPLGNRCERNVYDQFYYSILTRLSLSHALIFHVYYSDFFLSDLIVNFTWYLMSLVINLPHINITCLN